MTSYVDQRVAIRPAFGFQRGHDLGGGVTLNRLHIMVSEASVVGDSLELRAAVADRDTGQPLAINFSVYEPGLAIAKGEERRALIRAALLEVLVHEVDELLLLDGERNDPHPPPKYEITFTLDGDGAAELKKALSP